MEYTASIRSQLPTLFSQFQIKTLLDAPCGDFKWFQLVERAGIGYVGGDIVPALIESNSARYGDDDTRFQELDICTDLLPLADLWMCRVCLFHFSYVDIERALASFRRSKIAYLLTSTHTACRVNRDIPTEAFRQLNLELPPFNLPPPIASIDDWIEGFPQRRLALWSRDMLDT